MLRKLFSKNFVFFFENNFISETIMVSLFILKKLLLDQLMYFVHAKISIVKCKFFQFLDKTSQFLFSHFTKKRWIVVFNSAFPKTISCFAFFNFVYFFLSQSFPPVRQAVCTVSSSLICRFSNRLASSSWNLFLTASFDVIALLLYIEMFQGFLYERKLNFTVAVRMLWSESILTVLQQRQF